MLDTDVAAMFVDPDRTSEQSFLTADPATVARAVETVTGVQSSAAIPEAEQEDESSIQEQLLAMETGTL